MLPKRSASIPGWLAIGSLVGAMVASVDAANVAAKRPVVSSANRNGAPADKAVDGVINDASRWLGEGDPPWIEVAFDGAKRVTAADIYSGYKSGDQVRTFRLQGAIDGQWRDIPGGSLRDNDQLAIRVVFDRPVNADRVRLLITEPGKQGVARLRELRVWDDAPDSLPPIETVKPIENHPKFPTDRHVIFLNQSGFNAGWPKRFTAPQSPDGSHFTITPLNDNRVLYAGKVEGLVGRLDDFHPADEELLYVVRVAGGGLKEGVSDPFYVAPMLFQRVALEPALRLFVDDRSVTGSYPGAFGCAPWRDSPFYGYSTASLVNLYLSNPSFFDQLRVEMDFQRDLDRVLAEDFRFDASASENAMEIVTRMREEIDPPVGESVPDIVQLIHWGVSWWRLDPVSKDWAGSDERLHPETVTIPAFFLYGFPAYSDHFTSEYYEAIRDWTFEQWEPAGLLRVQEEIGGFKGRYAPGWTVLPNLMMHEVARREGRADADRYLRAAVEQARWVIETVDLSNPLNTKGQRMSEHKTISGLVTLLTSYPEAAPEGLRDYLREWADIMIARSRNEWDFRKYNEQHWSLPSQMPGMSHGGSAWNEPGNLAGFPYLAWSVASVLEGEEADVARRERLEELAVSHFDNLWGRNPLGCHSGWRGHLDYRGVERGWPVKYRPVCAHLHTARGALCSSAATEHYPFNPSGAYRHPEGWTAFNAAFNMGLVAANRRDTRIEVLGGAGSKEVIEGAFRLRLDAPVFGPEAVVEVTTSSGDSETLSLTAQDHHQTRFESSVEVSTGSAQPGDGKVQLTAGDTVTVTYGHGYFANKRDFATEVAP